MKSKIEWLRLVLAAIIAPSVPLLALAMTLAKSSGSVHWFPVVFLFGYLFFCLFGLPVIGILIRTRTLSSCILGGGLVTIVPILLLSLFSLSSSNHVYSGRMFFDLVVLFLTGGLGGMLFWGIAFAGSR